MAIARVYVYVRVCVCVCVCVCTQNPSQADEEVDSHHILSTNTAPAATTVAVTGKRKAKSPVHAVILLPSLPQPF